MISVDTAMKIHVLVSERTGGGVGFRDMGLLEGALASAYQSFGGTELYPTPLHKAVHTGYSVIMSHPFVDGNKRIGIVLMLTLLRACGVKYTLSDDDVVRIGLGVASGEMSEDALLEFMREHIE